MSEQVNPTAEEEQVITPEVVSDSAPEASVEAEPVAATAEPAAATAEPVAATAEPVAATAEPVAATAEPVAATAVPPAAAPRSSRPDEYIPRDDDSDSDDEDDEEFDGDDDDDNYVDGPATYIQPERGGRPRRIGSDVRVDEINYKNVSLLSRFLDQRGRILSRRKTRVSAKVQRRVAARSGVRAIWPCCPTPATIPASCGSAGKHGQAQEKRGGATTRTHAQGNPLQLTRANAIRSSTSALAWRSAWPFW